MMQIAFPLRTDGRGRSARSDDNTHIREMIEQLLFTNAGERVNHPELGSGLLHLVFAPNNKELAAALQFTVQGALQRYLGDLIELHDLKVEVDEATVRLDLIYLVRRSGERATARIERQVQP